MRYPQSTPLSDQVAEVLKTQYITGEARIGDRLPTENNMATAYNVTRTVIREARKVLQKKGWIEIRLVSDAIATGKIAWVVRSSVDLAVRIEPYSGIPRS